MCRRESSSGRSEPSRRRRVWHEELFQKQAPCVDVETAVGVHTGGAEWIRRSYQCSRRRTNRGARRAGSVREKASVRARRGLVRRCGAGNRRGWNDGAESLGCSVGGWLERLCPTCCAAASPRRSTCRRFSNRSAGIVGETAGGSTK